jgi:hypothetical protein
MKNPRFADGGQQVRETRLEQNFSYGDLRMGF